jgi:hypothetical protein
MKLGVGAVYRKVLSRREFHINSAKWYFIEGVHDFLPSVSIILDRFW